MSGRDFAQLETRSHDVAVPHLQRTKAILLVLSSLMLLACAFAVGFWLGHAQGKQAATGEDRARLEKQLKQQQQELAKLRESAAGKKQDAEVSTTQVGELTFYNELPRQAVIPAPLKMQQDPAVATKTAPVAKPAPPASQPAAISDILAEELQRKPASASGDGGATKAVSPAQASGGSYLLQVGSFQRREDAEQFANRFRPLGMTPTVREATLAGRGTWHRVYVGPFASKDEATRARARVQSALKIDGLVVKGG